MACCACALLQGETPIVMALEYGNEPVVKWLTETHDDIDVNGYLTARMPVSNALVGGVLCYHPTANGDCPCVHRAAVPQRHRADSRLEQRWGLHV